MTPHGLTTRSTLADVVELDRNLRPEDRRELEDITGKDAKRSLFLAALAGDPCLTLRTHEGGLIGLLSVARVGLSGGAIAFSGTPLIEQHSTAFLRGSRDILAEVSKDYDTLFNVCDARNAAHHRWLKWLGFHFIRKIDHYGAREVPVYEFARITEIV